MMSDSRIDMGILDIHFPGSSNSSKIVTYLGNISKTAIDSKVLRETIISENFSHDPDDEDKNYAVRITLSRLVDIGLVKEIKNSGYHSKYTISGLGLRTLYFF